MQIKNVFRLLHQETTADESVGISFAHLADNENLSFYATDILPGKTITPHYHNNGSELYFILSGQGMMHTWPAAGHAKSSHLVKRGDTFKLMPGTVHQLENNGIGKLVLLFACHPSHLTDDRIIVDKQTLEHSS